MSPEGPALRPLARSLLEAEGEVRGEPAIAAAMAEEVFRKLRDRLVKLVGALGFEALLRRALKLAKIEAPLLAPVDVARNGDLAGLAQALVGRSAAESIEASACLLAHFLELLATFIGADLTVRLATGIRRLGGESARGSEGK